MPRRPSTICVTTAAAAVALTASLAPSALGALGVDWTSRSSAADNAWNSIAYGNGIFVAVSGDGAGSQAMTSTNGVTWTSRGTPGDNRWDALAYGGGRFVAVANSGDGNRVMTSQDGINWAKTPASADTREWTGVAYGNGRFVAVSEQGGLGDKFMTSTDGINWSGVAVTNREWAAISYGGGRFVAMSQYGAVHTSTDGLTWEQRRGTDVTEDWRAMTYGNGRFVAVGRGSVMTSPDGVTWNLRVAATSNSWRSVAYGGGMFVSVSSTGAGDRVMTSPDGITWTSRSSAADNAWMSVAYGNGVFAAVARTGASNRVMTSHADPAPAPTPGPAAAPAATPAPLCTQSIYQQGKRTIAWNKKKQAYKVTSRIRIFEDAQSLCRTKLTVIYRNANTKTAIPQKSGSSLGYRKLRGKNFNAPVISWPTKKEMRFTTGDSTGENRKNARLVMVSYLKKSKAVPKNLTNIELVIVRRIPQNPAAATSSSNPLFAQKNSFRAARGWATVG